MKKLLLTLFCMTVVFSVYGTKAFATSVKSSDYLPSTQKSHYKEGTGYYLDNYRFKYIGIHMNMIIKRKNIIHMCLQN